MNKVIILVLFIMIFQHLTHFAQVGINTPNPEAASILELKDNERGFLPPRLTRLQRENMVNQFGPLPAGLMVYDTDDEMYYFYNPENGDGNNTGGDQNWQALAPIIYKDNKSDFQNPNYMRTIETHRSVKSVGFFVNTIAAAVRRFWVKGSVSISELNTDPPADYGLYAQGNSAFGADVNVSGNVTANKLAGIGVVPINGIILWHGSPADVPTGWRICDGTNASPDLRDKFVLGAGGSEPISGGSNRIKLSVGQLPAHDHDMDFTANINNDGAHTHTTTHYRWYNSFQGESSPEKPLVDNSYGDNTSPQNFVSQSGGAHSHSLRVQGVTKNTGLVSPSDINTLPPYEALFYIKRVE